MPFSDSETEARKMSFLRTEPSLEDKSVTKEQGLEGMQVIVCVCV